ncbi:MAG: glycosyltransferase family 4 protein [Chloroflexota bacterium]
MPVQISVPREQRQRLLVFNLRTDSDDHILGFTTRWLNELTQYYEHIDVLTTHKGTLAVADNITVYSTGRERGFGRLKQLATFYQTLTTLVLKHHYDACFAHMQPLFAALAAPILQMRGIKVTTWYTHRQTNLPVQLASRWSYRIVTAVESSFPVKTSKLRPLGHGIDPDFYHPSQDNLSSRPRIVQVARLTEIKNQHILLEAVKDLDCEVVFVGDIPDGYDDDYKQKLIAQVARDEMQERVIFAGAQTPEEVVQWYNTAQIAVNLSPAGLFDKAALESMSCATPTIISNPAFADLTGDYDSLLRIESPTDKTALQACIKQILALREAEYQHIGQHLREGIIAHHSLATLIKKLVNVMHTGNI